MKRHRIGAAGLTATGLLLTTACGSGGSDGGSDGGSMVFVGAGGAYQEAQTEAFIKPFEEQSGVTVRQTSPINYTKLNAMVDADNITYDVMEAYPYYAIAECGEHLEKTDYDIVDTTGVDPELIGDCAVPNMKSALLLAYNTETYPDSPPSSWADFFDTGKYPGTRGVQNDVNQGALEAALLADGVAPEDLYPLDYDRAFAKLDTLGDDLTFMATGADQEQALQNGTVDMMLAWPGRAFDAVEKGAPYAPVWNQAMLYYDVFVVPKGVENKDQVMEFLNLVVTPEAQATLTENIAYAPINTLAEPDITDARKEWLPLGQDNGTAFYRDQEWWAENLAEATDRWTAWTSG
jgi:putative spermidine/putrescine transport system substrate-binding protein